jgi:Beta-L-arabinofuranosidase, GH127 catalytic domain/Beta-L-arabinofuranosidase, GH127 middle domain/TAT (twin-arginine translocation) pathway signal sequence
MNRRTFLRASGALGAASALPLTAILRKAEGKARTSASKLPLAKGGNRFYVGNRPPLLPSPFMKLPIGAIEPRGWLRQQLLLMADGMTGHLGEFSHYLAPTSGWLTFKPHDAGWEEMPYWLRGYGDLGYVLKDERVTREAKHWLDAALSSQQPDGYFGPPLNKAHDDLWPNMLMLNALESLYESTGDQRVLPFMTRYCRFELNLPQRKLLPGSWQKIRGGDNLASVYWLYNRTGDPGLLHLGQKLFQATADWTLGPQTQHGVNNAQGFREPATYYQQSHHPKHLEATERNYAAVMDTYGQVPGGMFGADESWRPGKTGPSQAAETCSMVEFMHSFEMLLKITGNPVWADRCETVALNSLPAALTPDLKGLHYLTAPNLVECDPSGQHDFGNAGYLLPFSPREVYRCCQHNVSMGWPYYAEHLWLATHGNGLAAVLYAPNAVEARVGHGARVRIEEETAYPFGETVELRLSLSEPASFPLLLRVPAWCEDAAVAVNGARLSAEAPPASYISIERTWQDGDRVELDLPMRISLPEWKQQANAVSVNYGLLSFSLKIGERWEKVGGTEAWPDLAVYPTTPWNIGLIVDRANPGASFRVERKPQIEKQPFDLAAAPLELRGEGRLVPNWTLAEKMASSPPRSPVTSAEPAQEITLVPMGCARLRVSVFPTIA